MSMNIEGGVSIRLNHRAQFLEVRKIREYIDQEGGWAW